MNDKDKKNLELLLSHCKLLESHVEYFGDDKLEYMDNEHYRAACGFEILEIGEYVNRLSHKFTEKYSKNQMERICRYACNTCTSL